MLIDEVVVKIKGGKGGNGVISFKRNAQTAKGGPDGGNGGNGGNVYITGVNDLDTLRQFTYIKEVKAEDGVNGGRQNLFGRNGKDLIIKVPFGTKITDLENNFITEVINNENVLLAKGGKGGRGNNEFKTATKQAPRYRELGTLGEEKQLKFELKIIADIGLIGLPNAGKSSLLEALTNANPKIGDYPFTTLEPNLGAMDKIIIADIPGLIEGASTGRGLGDKFLKHIERTKVLAHCIDSKSNNLIEDYYVIREELKSFNPELLNKEELIFVTKSDLLTTEEISKINNLFKKNNLKVNFISIYNSESLNNVKNLFIDSLKKID